MRQHQFFLKKNSLVLKAEKRLKLKYSSMIFECASSTEQWPFRSWEKSSVCYIQDELMNLAIFLDADSDAAILG